MDYGDNGKRVDLLATPQRNNYFYGKLMDARHFQMEQSYGDRKRWLLNRLGLGEGILCGLDMTPEDGKVRLNPGVAIDALGREIIVPEAVCIDPWQLTDDCGRPADKLSDSDNEEPTVYICLAYHECFTEYMPVLVTDCDRGEQCAPGAIVESFHLLVQCEEPEGAPNTAEEECNALAQGADEAEKRRLSREALAPAPCPAPAKNPCVVLGAVPLLNGHKIGEIRRRIPIYSNARLLDLILCLATGGGAGTPGPNGDPGPQGERGTDGPREPAGPAGPSGSAEPQGLPVDPGLDPNLTHVCGINWTHRGAFGLAEFRELGLLIAFDKAVHSDDIIAPNGDHSLLVLARSFDPDNPLSCWRQVPGKIEPGNFTEPCNTSSQFTPQSGLVFGLRFRPDTDLSPFNEVRVVLKGDLIRDEKGKGVDGNHLPPWLPKRRSGDGIEGGAFDSWFKLAQ
jgi:hypothetical protein